MHCDDFRFALLKRVDMMTMMTVFPVFLFAGLFALSKRRECQETEGLLVIVSILFSFN